VELKTIAVFTIMVIALAGCQTLTASDDFPAWITNPDSGSRAALQAAVNEALDTDVALADDARKASQLKVVTWICRFSSG